MKIIAQNRRARYDYEILQTFEAGIQLTGQEVKSCRNGSANLQGAYVSIMNGTPMLKQATIAKYNFTTDDSYEPKRDRQLLLNKKEIETLTKQLNEKGISVVPLSLKAGKYVKIDIALVRGKKRYDKRENIKQRSLDRAQKRGTEY